MTVVFTIRSDGAESWCVCREFDVLREKLTLHVAVDMAYELAREEFSRKRRAVNVEWAGSATTVTLARLC